MPAHRFESFALGLDLDESFSRELPTATHDEVLRAIAESRLGRDLAAGGGTYACFMAKHDAPDRAFPTVQLAARHLHAPALFDAERMLASSFEAQRRIRDEVVLAERMPELRVGSVVGAGQTYTWQLPATNGITYRVVSMTALFLVGDVVYTVGVSGPDDDSFGVAGARALFDAALVDTSADGGDTVH